MGEYNAYNKNRDNAALGAAAEAFDAAKACFSCGTELAVQNAESAVCALADRFNGGDVAVITSDLGYFSAARGLKDALFKLGFKAVIFSADDGELNPSAINGFVRSIKNPSFALIIGGEDLYVCAATAIKPAGIFAVYLPTDCEIGRAFGYIERAVIKSDPDYLVLDEELIARSLNKQKAYSACCAVESARLLLFELSAFEALFCNESAAFSASEFNGLTENELESPRDKTPKTRVMLGKAFGLLNRYYEINDITALTLAGAITALCGRNGAVGNAAEAFALLMRRGARGSFGMRGELELYSAEALFLIYELLLSDGFYSDYSKSFTSPSVFSITERLKNDFSCDYGDISANVPNFIYDSAAIDSAVKALACSKSVKIALGELKSGLTLCRDNLNAVYGGKKRSVREYSLKNRAAALFSAPLCVNGFCVLKLAFSAGMLENLEG